MINETEHVIDHLDDYLHALLSAADGVQLHRHCDSCPSCQTALEEARKRLALLQAAPANEASEQQIQTVITRIESHDRQQRRLRNWFLGGTGAAAAVAAAIIVAVQIYYARLSATPFDLQVFGQTVLLPGAEASLRVRLLDRQSQTALKGVPVEINLRGHDSDEVVQLAHFTTDADGTGRPRFRLPEWKDGKYKLHIIAHVEAAPEVVTRPIRLQRSGKVMLSSDKPVYQPGQTIHVRALALRKPDLRPIRHEETAFAIRDPRGNIIFKEEGKTSKFGITATDCPLASEILEGPYAISCTVGEIESALTVNVKKYVLPKFKVNVELDHPYYAPGQTVQGTVRANYFFGKPVAKGTVKIEIRTMEEQGKLLTTLSTDTDNRGNARFAFELPKTLIGRQEESGDARVSFQVTVSDPAGQKQTRTVSRLVAAQALRIEIIPEAGTLVRGIANTIYLYVSHADGKPAARVRLDVSGVKRHFLTNELGVAVFAVTPDSDDVALHVEAKDRQGIMARREMRLRCGQTGGDFLLRTDKAVYNGGDTMNLVALGGGQEPVFVDLIKDAQTILTEKIELTKGHGQRQFDLSPEWFGTFELCAYRFGFEGIPIRKGRVLYIRPARQLNIRAKLDSSSYLPGARASVHFTLTDPQGKPIPGALSLAAVDEAVFSVLSQAPSMEQIFYMLEKELLRPIYAIFAWSPEMPSKHSDRERNQFEQALFARTASPMTELIRTTVKFEARMAEFRAMMKPGFDERFARNNNFINKDFIDEFAIERYYSSPHTLSISSYEFQAKQVEAEREKGLHAVEMAWTILAVGLGIMGYIALWWFLRPIEIVLAVHAIAFPLFCMGLFPFVGGSGNQFDKSAEHAPEREASRAASHTGGMQVAIGDASVRAIRKNDNTMSMREARKPASGVRVRSYFPETLFWQPQLVTDDHGRARYDFRLADSITTWRLSASGISAKGQLGATQTPIKVFQPFFIDLDLPVTLTRGDEVAIPVVIYNYLSKPQRVKLTLETSPWFKLLEASPIKEINLDGKQVGSTTFRVRVLRVGTHQLHLTARGQGEADAIKRSIEVVPDGRRVEHEWSGTLQEPAHITLSVPRDTIEDSSRAILKIYPNSFSQLVEGLDAIFQMPYGCFEQTSSTTYPNVLALDYLRRIKKSVPKVEAKARQYIHLGYQRLLSFEVGGGGFSLYGQAPADPILTAYGLMEFQDMARLHDVDPELLKRTRQWLLQQRNKDGSWSPHGHGFVHDFPRRKDGDETARLRATAYIASAVFADTSLRAEESQVTLAYLLRRPAKQISDPYVLALVCNALMVIQPSGKEVTPYLTRLDSLKQVLNDGKHVCWKQAAEARTAFYGAGRSGSIETTALAVLAMLSAKRYPETTQRALSWLVEQKDARGTWHSTQATVLALKAILAGTHAPLGRERQRRIKLTWDDGRKSTLVIPADQADVMKQIDLSRYLGSRACRLTITERSGTGAGYQVALRYHVPFTDQEKPEPLAIRLEFERTNLRVNDGVKAKVHVVNKTKHTAPMIILDLPIPAGFQFVDMAAIGDKYQVTQRNIIVYLRDLKPGKAVELHYSLRAAMPVKVAVPTARVYEYYDPDKQGFSSTKRNKNQATLVVE